MPLFYCCLYVYNFLFLFSGFIDFVCFSFGIVYEMNCTGEDLKVFSMYISSTDRYSERQILKTVFESVYVKVLNANNLIVI